MKLGKYTLTAKRIKGLTVIVCDEQREDDSARKFIYFTEKTERTSLIITKEIVNRCRVKQEIRQVNKTGNSPQGLHLLADLVEKDIREIKHNLSWEEWYRFWAYETIYQIAFNRGVRQERQRKKRRDNIGALTGNDIADLAQTLHIDINKLNTAVLELTASKGGKQ
uniref:hypothetical protein n=1 Tax=Lactococcus garvieae TaxID=1363 RepID=UPI00359C4EE8